MSGLSMAYHSHVGPPFQVWIMNKFFFFSFPLHRVGVNSGEYFGLDLLYKGKYTSFTVITDLDIRRLHISVSLNGNSWVCKTRHFVLLLTDI